MGITLLRHIWVILPSPLRMSLMDYLGLVIQLQMQPCPNPYDKAVSKGVFWVFKHPLKLNNVKMK